MFGKNKTEHETPLSDILSHLVLRAGGRLLSGSEPLADMEYSRELRFKNEALKRFWDINSLTCDPGPIMPSPLSRGYRSTSKRRVAMASGKIYFLHPGERLGGRQLVSPSLLEPPAHEEIFKLVHRRISRSEDEPLATALNWVIIRGIERGCALILNVYRINAAVVRKARQLSERISAETEALASVFLFHDPSRSEYYLEAGRETQGELPGRTRGVGLKCLAGPSDLVIELDDFRLRYPPQVFSQINESMIPKLLQAGRELLISSGSDTSADHLVDLYCGYGLFSFGLGSRFGRVTGIELADPAMEAARRNFDRISRKGLHSFPSMRFHGGSITAPFIEKVFASIGRGGKRVHVLLDPPRQGTAPGVIEAIAESNPQQVLHIFCNIDRLPLELRQWEALGYRAARASVLDLFPGTANVETLVLLRR